MNISVIIVTRDRKTMLKRCLSELETQNLRQFQVIIVDNGSEAEARKFLDAFQFQSRHIELIKLFLEENRGLTFGRNRGAEVSSGDILVWMDNDTFFSGTDALSTIQKQFSLDEDLAVLTYPVRERRGESETFLIPKAMTTDRVDESFETSYFLGGANAMKAGAFRKLGMFDESLIYQLEELDFAYRAANSQAKIKYVPGIELVHTPPHRKFANDDYYYYGTRNRIKVALTYLPNPYLTVHLALWTVKLGLKSLRDRKVFAFCRGFTAGCRELSSLLRKRKTLKLTADAVSWLKARHGRLWY